MTRHQIAVTATARVSCYVASFLSVVVLCPGVAPALTVLPRVAHTSPSSYLDPLKSAIPRSLVAALARSSVVSGSAALAKTVIIIPSFSRQTGLACSACHYQFPQLTPFGRLFKLNGYTMTGLKTIGDGDTTRPSLKLATIPPVSAMIVASLTHTSRALPAAQNNSTMFPEQASLFLGGEVTPNVGMFTQFTYDAQSGSFGIDNVDIRYANHTTWFKKDLLFGVTLHNNPTVQDVWNTVPAWNYPFMSSSIAPSPIASTLIEGNLGQQVLGLGGYALWDNLIYTEFTAYRSAQQGTHAPLDSASQNVISGVIPYGRLALQHTFQSTYLMAGGFGFASARVFPTGVSGPTNRYTTLGVDAQLEQKLGTGGAMLIGRTSLIHETQSLDASFDAMLTQRRRANLQSFRANVSYLPNTYVGTTLGYFSVSGSADTLQFAPVELSGSRTGSPNSNGFIGELTVNPWQNTRISLQYVAYRRFNGAASAYDVVGGRQAADNNNLYLYTWIAF